MDRMPNVTFISSTIQVKDSHFPSKKHPKSYLLWGPRSPALEATTRWGQSPAPGRNRISKLYPETATWKYTRQRRNIYLYKSHEITHFCWTFPCRIFLPQQNLLQPNNMQLFFCGGETWQKWRDVCFFQDFFVLILEAHHIFSRVFCHSCELKGHFYYHQYIRYLLLMDKIMHHLGWLKPYK